MWPGCFRSASRRRPNRYRAGAIASCVRTVRVLRCPRYNAMEVRQIRSSTLPSRPRFRSCFLLFVFFSSSFVFVLCSFPGPHHTPFSFRPRAKTSVLDLFCIALAPTGRNRSITRRHPPHHTSFFFLSPTLPGSSTLAITSRFPLPHCPPIRLGRVSRAYLDRFMLATALRDHPPPSI